jgi:hypothetical protein
VGPVSPTLILGVCAIAMSGSVMLAAASKANRLKVRVARML